MSNLLIDKMKVRKIPIPKTGYIETALVWIFGKKVKVKGSLGTEETIWLWRGKRYFKKES